MSKPSVILVGPLPPPIHGVTISTQRLLNSPLKEKLDLRHLDTSDHRSMETVGTLDIRNVTLGLASYWDLLRLCLPLRAIRSKLLPWVWKGWLSLPPPIIRASTRLPGLPRGRQL
jgi:hypothetical protein